jgi:hypothetical protein
MSSEHKRQEPPASADTIFSVVRKAQRKLPGGDLNGAHHWPLVQEVLQRRTGSDAVQRTTEEDGGFGRRMRQAVLITEFTDVVENARIEAFTTRHRLMRSSTYHSPTSP